MLVGKPILAGESDLHQLELIFDLCGTPTDDNMPGWRELPNAEQLKPRPRPGDLSQRFHKFGPVAVSLLRELLKLDWKSWVNANDALQHPYFRTAPLPATPGEIPTFEESHELDRRKFHDRKANLPPAPKGGTVGRGANDANANTSFNGGGYDRRNGANGGRYPHNGPPPQGDRRQPVWQRDHRDRDLPPRPPPQNYANGWNGAGDHPDGYRDRDARPPRGGARGGPREPPVDTYIPSYDREREGGGRRDPPRDDRRRHDWEEPRRHDRDRRWGGGGGEYDDRTRASRTRSRSRSPVRDRDSFRDRDYRRA